MRIPRNSLLIAVAAGLLLASPAGHGAASAEEDGTGRRKPLPPVRQPPAQILPVVVKLVLIDNSGADSWIEVDRTANSQSGTGTAGSDHEGE
ncbi:hypothetical protein [Streptomyces sp. NBC_01565]|uniref:hypothetical protein n=1 Tax=unclassified Streptomyces TaxID=2593676 RepID=UPI00225410A9|nr:hypothetical protein [Streptomyces sp. NBC_01565]MCX4546233.1 hypothetical protein [Streptomyces sp. NBC_01565]